MGTGETVKRLDAKDASKFGVTLFPALIVDGKVISEGSSRSIPELVSIIQKA